MVSLTQIFGYYLTSYLLFCEKKMKTCSPFKTKNNKFMKRNLTYLKVLLLIGCISALVRPAAAQTYCTPSVAYISSNNWIVNFETAGGISNISNATAASEYTDYSATQEVSAMQGTSVTFELDAYPSGSNCYARIWVDWNQDGDFDDADETVFDHTSGTGLKNFSGTITVPVGATPGTTRLRVKTDWESTTGSGFPLPDPCEESGWGEGEDYAFTVIASEPCEGTVTAGTIAGIDSICGNTTFSIGTTGATLAGEMTSGWQKSTSATGPWVSAGSVGTNLNVVGGITSTTYYRYFTTCDASESTDTTDVHEVVVKSATECYCTPSSSGTYYGCSSLRIDDFVTTGGVNNISNVNSNCAGSSGYDNNTTDETMIASQWQGSIINYEIKTEASWTGESNNVKMWVDWDQSGSFDTDEEVFNGSSILVGTVTGSLEVPADAVGGMTRLRIKNQNSYYPITSPCAFTMYTSGEVEDYNFEVLVPDPCDEVSLAAVTISGIESVCSGVDGFTLTATAPIASGITKTWERRSPAGTGTWTTIAGATTSILNIASITEETEYRYTVTCVASGESVSDTWTVGLNPPTECYCDVTYTGGCTWNIHVNDFSTTGGTANISNLGTGCAGSTGYGDYTDQFVTAYQGTMVNYTLNTINSGAVRIWIDWDQDGFFEASEMVYTSSASGYAPASIAGSVEVPYDAVPGATGMRIRTYSGYYGYDYLDACYTVYGGETEDYTFNVVEPPPCDEVAFTSLEIDGPESICVARPFTLTSSGTPIASGLTRIWQKKTGTGDWTTLTGGSLVYNVTAGITEETQYRYIVTCTLNGTSDTSNVWTVSMNPPTECYCDGVYQWAYNIYTWDYSEQIEDVIFRGDVDSLVNLDSEFPFVASSSDYGGYTNYMADSVELGLPDFTQTGTYTARIKTKGASMINRVWIDFDDDGIFDDSDAIHISSTDYTSGTITDNFSFTIPLSAAPGVHRMRIRLMGTYNTPFPIDPCYLYGYGETEDYAVLIKERQPCADVVFPESVMAYSSPPNVCGSGDIQLRVGTEMPIAAGVTYQWKSSATEDGTYTNVGSPIIAPLAPTTTVADVDEDTYFRCYVLCEGEPILISEAVFVQSVNLDDVEIAMEDGQTCGPGTVTLSGTTTDGSIFWYENPEGGSPIFMGDEFTTPLLTTDKTYYATGGAFGASDGIVGTGSGTSSTWNYGPFTPYYGSKQVQMMYTKADLNEAGITMGGDIESIAFNIASLPSNALSEYKISLKVVTTAPPMTWQTTGWTEVYNGTFDPAAVGWNTFAFDTPFEWDGSSNIMVKVCFKTPDESSVYSASGGTYKYTVKNGQILNYYSYASTTDACGMTYGYSEYNHYLPNAKFYIPGCETERVPVTAFVRPVPAPVNIGPDETVCKDPDGGLTLDVGTLPPSYTRLWSNGTTEQTTRITTSGAYSIVVANEFGCEVYDTVIKTLLEIPEVDLGPDSTVCEGGFVTLDAGDDGTNYMWNTGDNTQTYDAYAEGKYNVLVENSVGCIALDTITLTFDGHMPTVGSIITTNIEPFKFHFEPILTEHVTAYEWDFGDEVGTSELAAPEYLYTAPGSYVVTLTVYSTCGKNVYTTTTHILGVNSANIDDKSVNLYPNPAKDIAVIESKGNLKMKTVTVTNVLGQVIYQGEATAANKHQLELSAYASGLYTVRIETDKGFIVRKFEIIKQRHITKPLQVKQAASINEAAYFLF